MSMVTGEMVKGNRIDSLQGIRAIAFLGIFLFHSGAAVFAAGGTWGVSVFLVLSGFLMVYSYYDSERIDQHGFFYSIRFGIKKIMRLYPLHIAMLLLALPLLILKDQGLPLTERILDPAGKFVIDTALLQSWVPDNDIYFSLNGVSWYLSTALFLYMMFPLILFFIKKYRGIKTAVIVILITFGLQILLAFAAYLVQRNLIPKDDLIHWFVYIFPLSRLEDFVIGCNLGYLFLQRKKTNGNGKKQGNLLEFSVIILTVIEWILYVCLIGIPAKALSAENWAGLTVIWTMTSCALVYVFALQKGILSRLLKSRPFVFLGNLSDSCFLIHLMVYTYLMVFEDILFGKTAIVVNIILAFFITIAGSCLWKKIVGGIHNKRMKG